MHKLLKYRSWLTKKNSLFFIMAVWVLFAYFLLYNLSWTVDRLNASKSDMDWHTYSSEYFESWPGYDVKPQHSLDENIPIIIWWTGKGSLNPHVQEKEGASFVRLTCHNGVICYSTIKRSTELLSDTRTRGFIFYGTDFDPADIPLPRHKHHEWALLHEESPLNNYILTHLPVINLFNHTATFKRQSDYPLSTQAIYDSDYLFKRKPLSSAKKNEVKKLKGLAPIVYVQSHCDVPSDRDSYVKELMKYIAVDSYGQCLHNKDLPSNLLDPAETFHHQDFLNLLSSYKFTLAFENAYCDDYMTEKIMRPLHIGVVPIYKGSPVLQDWLPNNHSVIFVDNFSSPKELADFIIYLDENDEEYDKYLEFKHKGVENKLFLEHISEREWSQGSKDFFRGFECYLCKQLVARMKSEEVHARNKSSPVLPPKIADVSHLGCPSPERLDVGGGIKDYWPGIDWTTLYWEDLDRARALQHMMDVGETDSSQYHTYLFEEHKKYKSEVDQEL